MTATSTRRYYLRNHSDPGTNDDSDSDMDTDNAPDMENARSRRSSWSSTATSSRQSTWLPSQRPQLLLSQPLNARYITEHKGKDWFLTLACEINDRDPQGRMLAKAYLFFRDFMPRGLTGEFGHLHGNDVMRYLLSHPGESAVSRHRLSRDAEASFTELGKWMKNGVNWQEALRQSKTEGSSYCGRGLYSPEALLAVLIIAYPDMKLRDHIRKLQIEWMMSPRETLTVTDGFWKGINSENMWTVFKRQVNRQPQCELLLDYNTLFGENFPSYRKTMRRFLPADLQHLKLAGPPDLEDAGDIQDSDEPRGSDDTGGSGDQTGTGSSARPSGVSSPKTPPSVSLQKLHRCLVLPPPEKPSTDLEEWLIGKVVEGDFVYGVWCAFWEGKMRKAESYQDQCIIRSLFLRSLGNLDQICSMPALEFDGAEAYMLLDLGDDSSAAADMGKDKEHESQLEQIPQYSAWADIYTRFCKAHTQEGVEVLLTRLVTRQTSFFHQLLSDASLRSRVPGVLALDRLRMELLVRDISKSSESRPIMPTQEDVLDATTRRELQLTGWQIRCLLGGASSADVLTDFQLQLFHRQPRADDLHWVDLSKVLPVPPQRANTDTLDDRGNQVLRQLFGDLQYQSQSPVLMVSPLTPPAGRDSIPAHGTLASILSQARASTQTPGNGTPNGLSAPAQATPKPLPGKFSQFALYTAKRQRTPERGGSAKKPRLGDLTREEYREDIRAEVKELQSELSAQGATQEERYRTLVDTIDTLQASLSEAVAERDRLRTDLQSETAADRQRLRAEIKSDLSSGLETGIQRLHKGLLADLTAELAAEAERRYSQLKSELTRDLTAAFKIDLAAFMEQNRMDLGAMDKALRGVREEVTSVSITMGQVESSMRMQLDARSKRAELGNPGYLSEHCPAPEGLNQDVYVARLLRAAWGYMIQRGDPDDGVDIDPDTIMKLDKKFPDLLEEHVIAALRHVHMRAYHRPFPL